MRTRSWPRSARRDRGRPAPAGVSRRRSAALFAAASLALAACARTPNTQASTAGSGRATGAGAGAEILWDDWGVPHVYAGDAEALLHAFGWAQAEAHGDLVLELYGEARGRAAEYWGPEHAEADRLVRTLGIPGRARDWYRVQDPVSRRLLDAFADGFNAYARAHPERIDDRVETVLPVTGSDPLAHLQRAIHFTFVVPAEGVAAGLGRSAGGSNAWAIAPSRTESGRAILVANPHLPWFGLFTWFEAHLVAPGLDAYGATLVGMPILAIAFNDRLGWSHTVNPLDAADVYRLTLDEGGYRWGDGVRPFEARPDTVRVRQPDGTIRIEPFTVRSSVHGPVIAEREGEAFALRVAGLDQPHLFDQYWEMMRATDLATFEAALARLQLPMFNVVYADADGHVLYVFNGRVPVRPSGGWEAWTGVVPGDTPATLWTQTHDYADLPRVLDPPGGWVQNANDPPWTSTIPQTLEPGDYPLYMAPRGMDFRPQRSAAMLAADPRISFDEAVGYKHSTRMLLADRLLDDLLPPAREGSRLARRAADVLAAWDRAADAESRGGVLFAAFAEELFGRADPAVGPFAVPWDPARPLATPDGLGDPGRAVAALAVAARKVEAAHAALDVAWGEVHRLRAGAVDLPANGADGALGVFRVTDFAPDGDGRLRAVGGDSYVAVVEFGDSIRARGLLAYGNASQAGSSHRGDQFALYARQELRPIWRSRAEVVAHLERREAFRAP